MGMQKLPLHHSHVITQMGPLDKFVYEAREYHPLSWDDKGYRFQSADSMQLELRLSHEQIAHALHMGTAEIHYNFHTKEMTKLRMIVGDRTLDDFEYNDVIMAFRYERFILKKEERCRELGRALTTEELTVLLNDYNDKNQPRHIEQAGYKLPAQDRCNKKQGFYNKPSTRTFYRKEREYLSCGRDVRCLIPRHHGPGKSRHVKACPESFEIWHEVARDYMSRRKPSKAALLRECKARIHEENIARKQNGKPLLIAPNRRRFEALINSLDEFAVLAGREGPTFARSVYKAKMTGFDIDRPGERVEMDGWTVNLETLFTTAGIYGYLSVKAQEICKAHRVVLIAAIDVATRYVLGVTASLTANSSATLSCLEMVLSDKEHIARSVGAKSPWFGLRPEAVETDNGPEFFADRVRAIFVQAMIALSRPPAGQPFRRPFIETLFKTFGAILLPFFDGQTFSNIFEKGDYDSIENATLATEEFLMLLIRGICDVYHHTPHSSLNGNTPHNAFVEKTSTFAVRAMPGPNEMRNLFGVTLAKTVTSEGVVVHGIPYNSDTLQEVRRQEGNFKTKVRFHRNNLTAVSVQTERGWLTVKNTVGLDRSITFGEWITASRLLHEQNAGSAELNLGIMYDAINDIRKSADAAAVRENIGPHRMSDEDHAYLEKSMFEGRVPFAAAKTPPLAEPPQPDHPLHHGSIGERAPSITTLQDKKDDNGQSSSSITGDNGDDEFGDF